MMSTFDLDTYIADQERANSAPGAYDNLVNTLETKRKQVEEASARKTGGLQALAAEEARRNELLDKNPIGSTLRGGLVDSDKVRGLSAGLLSMLSATTKGAAEYLDNRERVINQNEKEAAKVLGTPYKELPVKKEPGMLDSLASYLNDKAQEARDERTIFSKNRIADSQITGEFRNPSTWDFGKDPSLEGYLDQGTEVIGQMAVPVANAFGKTATLRSLLLGALQGGGAQAQDTEEYIRGLSDEQLKGFSTEYARMREKGVSEEVARKTVEDDASSAAAGTGAVLGAAGGLLTKGLVKDLPKHITGNVATRIAKELGTGFVTEGAQEVAETELSRLAANMEVGGNRNTAEGTLGDFVLGGMGGSFSSGVGATAKEMAEAANAYSERQKEKGIVEANVRTQAVKDGDIAPFLSQSKEDKKRYNPAEAMNVLEEHLAQYADTPEKKAAALQKAESIVNFFQTKLDTINNTLQDINPQRHEVISKQADEGIAAYQAMTAEQQESAEGKQKYAEVAELITKAGDIGKSLKSPEYKASLEKEAKTLASQVKLLTTKKNILDAKFKVDPITPTQQVETPASTPVDPVPEAPESSKDDDDFITLAMMSPDKHSSEEASRLASLVESQDGRYTGAMAAFDEANKAVDKVKAAAKAIGKTLDKVHENVTQGTSPEEARYVGFQQYKAKFLTAIKTDPKGIQAKKPMADLAKFAQRQRDKANAVNEAQSRYFDTEQTQYVGYRQGKYQPIAEADYQEKRDIRIGNDSQRLIDYINSEAAMLETGHKAMQEAYALKYNPKVRTQVPTQVKKSDANTSGNLPSEDIVEIDPEKDAQEKVKGLDKRQLEALIAETERGQEKRKGLLESEKTLSAYAKDRGISIEEMRTLLTTNYVNNQKRLPIYREALAKAEKANTSKIQWGATEKVVSEEEKQLIEMLKQVGNERISAGASKELVAKILNDDKTSTDTKYQLLMDLPTQPTEASNGQEVQTQEKVTQPLKPAAEGSKEVAQAPTQVPEAQAKTKQEEQAQEILDEAPEITSEDLDNEASDEQVVPESGQLSVMKAGKPAGFDPSIYRTGINWFASLFKQSANKANAATGRPLVSVKNFLSNLQQRNVDIRDYLDKKYFNEDNSMDVAASKAVNNFIRQAVEWNKVIYSVLPHPDNLSSVTPEQAKYRNPIEHMFGKDEQGNVVVDENLLTAFSVAIHDFVVENGTTRFNDDDVIRSMFGLEKEDEVTQDMRNLVRYAGTRGHLLTFKLGRSVIDALGIEAFKHTPTNELSRLTANLGAMALQSAVRLGLVQENPVNRAAYVRIIEDVAIMKDRPVEIEPILVSDREPVISFYSLKYQDQNNPRKGFISEVNNIVSVNQGTSGVVSALFSVEPGLKEPSFEPVKFNQTTAKRTKQGVPSLSKKAFNKMGERAYRLREGMTAVYSGLSDASINRIVGMKPIDQLKEHKVILESEIANNENKERELSYLNKFINQVREKSKGQDSLVPFYFGIDFWKPQRAGYLSNTINPQTSKIHRYMLAMDGWKTEVKFSDKAMVDSFMLRVAEGFGVSTDKAANEDSLKQIRAIFKEAHDPTTKHGKVIDILNNFGATDLEPEQEEALVSLIEEYVKKGAEGMHTLSSLIAMADYINAAKNPKVNSFSTDLITEIDGVTNGPMIALFMLGAADPQMLERGGFFTREGGHKDHNKWRKGNQDLYEFIASGLTRVLSQQSRNKNKASLIQSLVPFTGELINKSGGLGKDARKFVKNPVTTLVFGSSVGSTVSNMAQDVIENMYKAIGEIARKHESVQQAELDLWLKNVNNIIQDPRIQLKDMTLPDLLQFEFSSVQKNAIRQAVIGSVGDALEKTLTHHLSTLIDRQKAFNKVARNAFRYYRAAYEALKQQEIDKLVAEEKIAVVIGKDGKPTLDERGKQIPIHGLNQEQEEAIQQSIRHLLPTINTAMSKASTGKDSGPSTGILMAKRDTSLADPRNDREYLTEGKYVKEDGKPGYMRSAGERILDADPGVASLILAIHSSDSAIAQQAYMDLVALNIHDALGVGIKDAIATAQKLNEMTYKTLLEYSIPGALYERVERTTRGLAVLIKEETEAGRDFARLFRDKYRQIISNVNPKEILVLQGMLRTAKNLAYEADRVKLNNLIDLGHVNQYSFEGGSYEVTAEMRQEAIKKLAALEQSQEVNQSTYEAADFVRQVFQFNFDAANAPEITLNEDDTNADENSDTGSSVVQRGKFFDHWANRLGEPEVAPDSEWEAFFNKYGGEDIPAADVITKLREKVLATKGGMAKFQLELLSALEGKFKEGLKFKYITTDTDPASFKEEGVVTARGWFAGSKSGDTIYIRSPEFKYSAVTTEIVMHELLHAGLMRIIEEAKKAKADPELKAIYNELEALRQRAEELVKGKPEFKAAVKDVHELISWGLTNEAFQREILNKITDFQRSTVGNRFITGFKAFLNNVAKMIFRKRDGESSEAYGKRINSNGLGVLIINTSGLLNAPVPETSISKTLRMAANSMTTEQVFDAVGQLGNTPISILQESKLRGLITEVINKVRTPFEIYETEQAADPTLDPIDRFVQTLANGTRPFVSQVHASPFRIAPQTAFVLENVEAVINASLASSSLSVANRTAYKSMERIYKEARHVLTPESFFNAFIGGNWNQAVQNRSADMVHAEEMYNFVFNEQQNADGTSDAISRFAAMALTIPEFESMLSYESYRTERRWKDMSWPERIRDIFSLALRGLSDLMSGTIRSLDGMEARLQIRGLVDRLVDIENRNKAAVIRNNKVSFERLESFLKEVRLSVTKKGGEIAKADMFANSRFATVRLVSNTVSLIADERVEFAIDWLRKKRDEKYKALPGFVAGVVDEIRGVPQRILELISFAKFNETHRQHIEEDFIDLVRTAFKDKGEWLTDKMESLLTEVLIQTDTASLLGPYSMNQIQNFLVNSSDLKLEIRNLTRQLNGIPFRDFYVGQVKDLGFYLATERIANTHQLFNAYAIANRFGVDRYQQIPEATVNQIEPILDRLATLYALSFLDENKKAQVADVMRTENERTEGNGVEFILKAYKKLQKDSEERLFENGRVQMQKGYIPQIYNEGTELTVADVFDGAELEKKGWIRGPKVTMDNADPSRNEKYMYVLADKGLNRYVSGAISWKGTNAKGTIQGLDFTDVQRIKAAKTAEIQALDHRPNHYMPNAKARLNYMAPILRPDGTVSGYRYMMNSQTRDTILERDRRITKVMGRHAASIFDKESAPEQNRKVMEVLKQQYDEEYESSPDSFLTISDLSRDPKLREYWIKLPQASKDIVFDIWGSYEFKVKTNVAYAILGYRLPSVADPLLKNERQRALAGKGEQLYVKFVEAFGQLFTDKDKVGLRLYQAEKVWQELVTLTKDILVIRRGFTLFQNMVSNVTQLMLEGVPFTDIIKNMRIAMMGAIEYRAESRELEKLKAMREMGVIVGTQQEMDQAIIRLEDSLRKNPTRDLIEAGLMPTIVEDVALQEDPYSYKTKLQKKTKKYTDRIPVNIRTGLKYVVVAQDTPLYKALSQGTQLSDFVSRYVLHQHLTTKADSPMSKRDSIEKVTNSFVSYDIPSHPTMEALNANGAVYFTKYYLRIQRVLLELVRGNPGKALAMILVSNYLDGMQTIMDAGPSLGNPLENGAFKLLEAIDEPLPIKLVGNLF